MNDANDVSVLLNLTGKLVIELVNPLMDLVSGRGTFLFYDQLSLERFPRNQEEQDSFVWKLLNNMRNLLGSRRLSSDDRGGKIRIIVTLDLVNGFAHRKEQSKLFPAQKVRRFLEMLHCAFENEVQLLSRFQYTFIFMEWDDDDRMAGFYRTLAYDGCLGSDDWLSSSMLEINRDKPQGADLNLDLSLDDISIKKEYAEFLKKLNAQEDRISAKLAEAGIKDEFRSALSKKLSGLRTFGELLHFDFDTQVKTIISELIGLRSPEFSSCNFFIFKMRTATISHRKKDELVLFSLLQLLGTAKDRWISRLSMVDGSMNEHSLNAEALAQLAGEVSSYLSKMKEDGKLRWAASEKVTYRVFSERNTQPTNTNIHSEHNEETDQQRNELYDNFENVRRVPFFFGHNHRDWNWFFKVSGILDEIYAYEMEHDHPRYASPGRITEKEMNSEIVTRTYADLEEEGKKLESSLSAIDKGGESKAENNMDSSITNGNLLTDLKDYLTQREDVMKLFAKYKDKLKKEMVKLGVASVTYLFSFLTCLIVTLCYAFHFIYTGDYTKSLWILACLAAIFLVCGLSALMAQSHIKSAIKSLYCKIDECRELMKKQRDTYFDKINTRVKLQNKADIRRRNLEEIQEKLNTFKFHNMQVDLWEKYFSNLKGKLNDMLQCVGRSGTVQVENNMENETLTDDLLLDEMPCLPESICKKFLKMNVSLSPSGADYKEVTCFLNNLNVTLINE